MCCNRIRRYARNMRSSKNPRANCNSINWGCKTGAAIAYIHVREEDGRPSRRLELYKEVVDRIRSSGTDVILNLTTGMGGDLDIGQGDNLDFAQWPIWQMWWKNC